MSQNCRCRSHHDISAWNNLHWSIPSLWIHCHGGLTSLIDIVERIETNHIHSDIILLGDLNTRSFALGNSKRNRAGSAFDSWFTSQDTFELHEQLYPTCKRGNHTSFLDVLLFKGTIAVAGVVDQAELPYSDHTSFLLSLSWETEPRFLVRQPRFQAKDQQVHQSLPPSQG